MPPPTTPSCGGPASRRCRKGHLEAADCVGLSQAQTMGRIILPEMTMIMLPAMVNMTILMLKETAILSIISVPELTLTVSAHRHPVLRLRRELHRAGAALLGRWSSFAAPPGAMPRRGSRSTASHDPRRPHHRRSSRTSAPPASSTASRSTRARGEVTCIIGPSGSGKSTLLRCIAFLEEATDGLIEIDGEPLGFGPTARRRPGAAAGLGDPGGAQPRRDGVPAVQPLAAYDRARQRRRGADPGPRACREAPRRPKRAGPSSSASASRHRADHYPSQLSGGQQQRVAIARALALEPRSCSSTSPPPRSTPS